MLQHLALLWLALALSLDSFNVGITYGMRKIKFPFLSYLVIGGCSGGVIFLSMHLGNYLSHWISPHLASGLGAVILIALGILAIVQNKKAPQQVQVNIKEEKIFQSQESTPKTSKLQHILSILRSPVAADADQSGSISMVEAIFLGLALSLDSFGAGLGAGVLGISPILAAITNACMSPLFLIVGIRLGFLLSNKKWTHTLFYLPGIFLIVIAFVRLF